MGTQIAYIQYFPSIPILNLVPTASIVEKVQSENGESLPAIILIEQLGKGAAADAQGEFNPEKQKVFRSNSEGVLTINMEEKGTYFLEATTYNEIEPAKTKKASFKSV